MLFNILKNQIFLSVKCTINAYYFIFALLGLEIYIEPLGYNRSIYVTFSSET